MIIDKSNYIYIPQKTRFYILFTYSFYSFVISFLWCTWQPIMISLKNIYNWNLTEINFLISENTIVFCIFIVPFLIFWNKLGMQRLFYISATIVFIGCLIRLYPGSIYTQSLMIIIGNGISAFGNLFGSLGATGISALWFPSHERCRSTTTAMALGALGAAMSPIISSKIVPDIQFPKNTSWSQKSAIIKHNIEVLLFIHCIISLFSLLFIVAYFPSKPFILPCKSSERDLRMDLAKGFKSVIKNRQYWLVFIIVFILIGITPVMFSLITSILLPLQISQNDAAYVNFACNLCMVFGSVFGGWLGDRYSYKLIIWGTVPLSILLCVVFGLQVMTIIQHNLASIYAVTCLLSFVSVIPGPISFEIGCEVGFPASEEVSTAILMIAANIGATLLLSLTMIPHIGTKWIPFTAGASLFFILPIIYIFIDVKKRCAVDHFRNEEEVNNSDYITI